MQELISEWKYGFNKQAAVKLRLVIQFNIFLVHRTHRVKHQLIS